MKRALPLLAGLGSIGLFAIAQSVAAQSIVYTNRAQNGGAATIRAYDKTTGALVQSYSGVAGNGRGVVVVGNTIYYTMVSDPNIYMLDVTTGLGLGSIPTAVPSMSTIGWDGSQFWTSDYSGSNKAYRINLAGTTTTTLNLINAVNFYDGLEYFNGKLIANRKDGGFGGTNTYDVYDLTGALLTPGFILTTGYTGTGIAYDGTNFLISDVFGNGFGRYNGTTGAFINFVTYSDFNTNIEDLSVDYAQREDTGGGSVVPEPSTMLLLASGLVAAAGARKRSRRRPPQS